MVTSGNQKFVERSHIIFADEKRNICPCCYQLVSGEYRNKLIECIERVLNKDVKNFEERLIKNKIELLSFDSELYKTLDSKTISEIIISINECNEIISKYNEYINKRPSS